MNKISTQFAPVLLSVSLILTSLGNVALAQCPVTITQSPANPICGVNPVLTANVAGAGAPVTYSASFVGGGNPTAADCNNWNSFLASLTGTYGTMRFYSNLNAGLTLSDPATVQDIANSLRTGAAGTWNFAGNTYYVGSCGGTEIAVNNGGICQCGNAYSLRPCIGNSNWGGVNTATCGGPSQTITLEFLPPLNITYAWSNGAVTQSITPGVSGTYSVTITNTQNGCTSSASTNIVIHAAPSVTVSGGGGPTCGFRVLTANPTGGAGGYTYNWGGGVTTQSYSANATGTHTVTITDAVGCTATASGTVTIEPAPNAVFTVSTGNPACGVANAVLAAQGGGAANLQDVLNAINANQATLLATVPNPSGFNMDNGVNGNQIGDGCSDMYDGGNFINTNLANNIQYSDNVIVSNPGAYGAGGQYFTRYLGPGGCQTGPPTMFFWAADISGLSSVRIEGNNGADGSGTVDGTTFTVTNAGVTYYCFLKRVYNAGDPSINQLFIIPSTPGATHTFSNNSNDGNHQVNLSGATRMYYLLYAGASGSFINNAQALNIAQTFVNLLAGANNYVWSTGATTQSITINASGTYSLTVTGGNGCTSSYTEAVLFQPAVSVSVSGSGTFCGQAVLTATGAAGTPNYSYNWGNGVTTQNFTATSTGTYVVTLTDAVGCTATASGIVTIETAPAVTITQDPPLGTCGVFQYTLTANANGGGGNINGDVYYLRSQGGNPWGSSENQTAMNAVFGGAWTEQFFETVNPTLIFTPATRFIFMDGSDFAAGAMETFINNNIGLIQNWVNNGGHLFMNNAPNTGGNQNWGFGGVVLNYSPNFPWWEHNVYQAGAHPVFAGPFLPVQTSFYGNYYLHAYFTGPTLTNILTGGAIGQVGLGEMSYGNGLVMFGGMTTPGWHTPYAEAMNFRQNLLHYMGNTNLASYTYQWNTGATSQDITVAVSGTYTVTVTADNGCTGTADYTVTFAPAVNATVTGSGAFCAEKFVNGTGANGTPPYTYLWDNGVTTQGQMVNASGTYVLTITDAVGCTAVDSAVVTINPVPTVTITQDPPGVACGGAVSLIADAQNCGTGNNLVYSQSFTQFVGTGPGDIQCDEWDNFRSQLTGTYNQMRVYSNLNAGVTLTDPATVQAIAAAMQAGVPGSWTFGPDTYNVSLGCGPNGSVVELHINQSACNCASAITVRPCIGNENWGGVNVNNCTAISQIMNVEFTLAIPPCTYAWNTGETTAAISPLNAGTYTVTVTTPSGCTATADYVLNVFPGVAATISGEGTFCGQAVITANGTGGTPPLNYLWNNGATTTDLTVTASGTYTVTVTDAIGCSGTASAAMVIEAAPVVTIDQNPPSGTCGVNQVTLTAQANGGGGGVVGDRYYLGSVQGNPWGSGDNQTAMNMAFGGNWIQSYFETGNAGVIFSPSTSFVFLDGSDFTAQELYTFLQNNQTLIENWVAAGGHLFINSAPNEGGNMNWGFGGVTLNYNGNTPGLEHDVYQNIPHPVFNGPFLPVATSYYGNWYTHGYITGPGLTNILIGSAGFFGLSEMTWGSGMVMFGGMTTPNWHTPAPQGQNFRANLLDYMGNAPVVTYTYQWNTGATTQDITTNTPGTYTVTVTSNNGCTGTATVNINFFPAFTATAGSGGTFCAQTTLTGTPIGGTAPFTYDWGGGITTQNITVTTSGTYTVTITDGSGCTATASANIVIEPVPTVTVTQNPPAGACGGNIALIADAQNCGTGANVVYSQSFTQGVGSGVGGVQCTAWDAFRAQLTGTYNQLRVYSTLNAGITLTDPATIQNIANALRNGTTGSFAFGGNTYSVSTGCGPGGVVELHINQGSCTCGAAISVRPCIGNDNWGGVNGSNCGAQSQTINVEFTLAIPPCTYLWNTGETTDVITPLTPGTYTVTVTSPSSCTATSSYVFNVFPAVTASISGAGAACGQATLTANPSGGTAPFSYVWNNGATTQSLTTNVGGTFDVTITDANGCTSSATGAVTINPAPTASISQNPAGGLCGGATATLTASSTDCGPGASVVYSQSFTQGVGSGVGGAQCTAWNTFRSQLTGSYTQMRVYSTLNSGVTLTDPTTIQNIANALRNGTTGSFSFGGNTYSVSLGCGPGGVVELHINQGSCTCGAAISVRPCIGNDNWGGVNGSNCGAPSQTINVEFTSPAPACGYLWSTGATTAAITTQTPGNYIVTVTAANGCTGTAQVNIPGANFTMTLVPTNASCNGAANGSINLTVANAQNPVSYLWNTGGVVEDPSGLIAGTYTVTVTDAGGCTGTGSAVVGGGLPLPNLTVASNGPVCVGSSIQLSISPFTPGTYAWTGPVGYTASGAYPDRDNATLAMSGTYSVTYTDANGCTTGGSVAVIVNACPEVCGNGVDDDGDGMIDTDDADCPCGN